MPVQSFSRRRLARGSTIVVSDRRPARVARVRSWLEPLAPVTLAREGEPALTVALRCGAAPCVLTDLALGLDETVTMLASLRSLRPLSRLALFADRDVVPALNDLCSLDATVLAPDPHRDALVAVVARWLSGGPPSASALGTALQRVVARHALTRREHAVLQRAFEGQSSEQICNALRIRPTTYETLVRTLLRRVDAPRLDKLIIRVHEDAWALGQGEAGESESSLASAVVPSGLQRDSWRAQQSSHSRRTLSGVAGERLCSPSALALEVANITL